MHTAYCSMSVLDLQKEVLELKQEMSKARCVNILVDVISVVYDTILDHVV
jgi:hypothetical protein